MDTVDAGRIGGKATSLKKRQAATGNLEKARKVVAAALAAYKAAQDGEEKSVLLGDLKTTMVDAEETAPPIAQLLEAQ